MGCLIIKANEYDYKEQFINCINDDIMMEIIGEITTFKRTNEITSEQVLSWAKRVEEQRTLRVICNVTHIEER